MFLSPEEVKTIASKIIGRSRAETCTVSVSGSNSRHFRFAKNKPTTNGAVSDIEITIESSFGLRSGSVTVNSLDDSALEKAQAQSEEIARLSPENPEFMPPLPPQTYEAGGARFDPATANITADALAGAAKSAIGTAKGREAVLTGFVEASHSFHALANSAGLFAYDQGTSAELTTTARNTSRPWSGWAGASQNRFSALNAEKLGGRAVEKAAFRGVPADLDPGVYTVVLEPGAVADLVQQLLGYMELRSADEGRSYLSKPGGGTKLNEKLLDEHVTIASDPADPIVPDTLWGEDGLAKKRTVWFERGVARQASCSRFWAKKTGRDPLPRPQNLSMAGGAAPIEDMIRDIKRGILVTRFWYVNTVDPRTLLSTGMTRDGNFLIENGKIIAPALNLRFNESPVSAFSNIEAIGAAERTISSHGGGHAISAPPLMIKGFTFSSKSSGI
jgi:predicted Zn-dependent protease